MYEVSDATKELENIFDSLVQNMFYGALIITNIWLIISLVIWFFGATKKSEKSIKFGISNFIITVILNIVILLVPLIL